MQKFSQRNGYNLLENAFQRERVDPTLRRQIWNYLSMALWNKWHKLSGLDYDEEYDPPSKRINKLAEKLWLEFFKWDVDDYRIFKNSKDEGSYLRFKNQFFRCEWWEVYDFIEFILEEYGNFVEKGFLTFSHLVSRLNSILEKENSVYRIVDHYVVEITDIHEMDAIEEALNHHEMPIRTHIQTALEMLSNRQAPDYRNSIKESISAVEATCRLITGKSGATLGEALKKVPNLHPALKSGLSSLYGFTSDADGIRHSLLDESNLTYADAKFMLSACSSFVSYLRVSAATDE